MNYLSTFDKLASRITYSGDCWVWTGAYCTRGYGVVRHEGAARLAHRVSYELHEAPIPAGLVIDHLCRVRGCINPDHLEVVTTAENTRRGFSTSAATVRTGVCQRGHELTEANTYRRPSGGGACRTCRAAGRKRHVA